MPVVSGKFLRKFGELLIFNLSREVRKEFVIGFVDQ